MADVGICMQIKELFYFLVVGLYQGFKYLGYHLKLNYYQVEDWNRLLQNVDKRIKHWTFQWLSLRGRLVLVKCVLQSILVYWFSIFLVLALVISSVRKNIYQFLWSGGLRKSKFHLASWEILALPKYCGSWGIKRLD